MMKKVLKLVAVAVVVVLAINITGCGGPKTDCWYKNKVTAKISENAISEDTCKPPTTEIYLDASGSMKPYYRAEHPINLDNTLTAIWSLNPDGTSFYSDGGDTYSHTEKIINIIKKLSNKSNRGVSIFHDFFEKQARKIDSTNTLVVLVTDGIMSEGYYDMDLSLLQFQGTITRALTGYEDLAGAILRYKGDYKGDYWNQISQRMTSKECPLLKNTIQRPYYLIVLGQKCAIRWLQSKSDKDLNNPEGKLFMNVHDFAGYKKGTLDKDADTPIEWKNKPVEHILELPECLTSIDPQKVMVMNENNKLDNVIVSKDRKKLSATIEDPVKLKRDRDGRIKISFIAEDETIPNEWLSTWSTDNDKKGPDTTTTYGLSYLVKGMFEGLEGNGKKLIDFDFVYKLPK